MPEFIEAGGGSGGGRERHEPEGSRWITVHPSGADSKGQPVLISGSGMVLGGLGGKFNGQHIADVHKGSQGTAGNVHTQAVHPEHNAHMATWQGMQDVANVTVHGTPEQHASGAHSVHITGGKDLEATLNKHGQGTTESGAFLERHPSGGVIYHGTSAAPHDYDEFAHHMAADVMGHVMGFEHTKEMAKPGKSAYKEETAAEGRAYRQQVMKQVRDFVRGEGGIKAHGVATEGQAKRGLSARQGDEYNRVPSWAKNAASKHTMDTMAPIVGAQFPHLGIETEDDLREYLVQHEATRKADATADETNKQARGHARAALREADMQEDADLTVTDSEGEESDPMDVADAELVKTEPDVLTPQRRHTRARDGKYNGAETVLERGPRTGVRMTESVALDEARTDRSKREVLLRIISPGFGSSRDPKSGLPVYYTEAALQEAAPLFAGKKCFLNHATPAERKARPEGDITRWGATIKESWWDASHRAPVGRTRVVNSNLWEAIELDPEEVACSIRAHGTGRVGTAEGQQAWLCEHIDTVHSVDFVTYAGARGGVIEILESGRAAVRFTAEEEREAQRDMFEDITETDLRESRPDLVEAILRTQKPAPVDLTEALRPYQERVQRAEEAQAELERKLNNRDARSLVDQALAACGLPKAATERVRVQFAESTYGFDGASHGSDAELVEAVGKAATAEGDYIKSVTAPEGKRTITGMGAAAPTIPQPVAQRQVERTTLQEAASRLDNLLTTRPQRGPAPEAPAGVPLQSRMDALVGSGAKG